MIKRIVGVVILCLVAFTGIKAQRATQLRINEVMPVNTDNFQDDYGKHSSWIEIFNTSYATVNIGGCYLTDDLNNPKKYLIQKGDVKTRIKPRQHVVFWADNNPQNGTFHVNFAFTPGQPKTIYLFDSNGKTLIDKLEIPACPENVSYGRKLDGGEEAGLLAKATPDTNNQIVTSEETLERFKKHDPSGMGMSLTAMFVVFIALIILYLMFKAIGAVAVKAKSRRIQEELSVSEDKATEMAEESGDIYAAIAMALYELNNEAHDIENTVLTIDKVTRTYSPWNSKIYAMRALPKK